MSDWVPAPIPEPKPRAKAASNVSARGWHGAQLGRLTNFAASLVAAHEERRRDLVKLRAHARDLANNNAYLASYIKANTDNVIGHDGIGFKSTIIGNAGKAKDQWNWAIEDAWASWCKSCTLDGETWVDLQHLLIKHLATDGEVFVRLVRGAGNPFGLALEVIDADRVDEQYNQPLPNGNRVIMGVEVNASGLAVAYHVWSVHPADYWTPKAKFHDRIPASEVIHLYIKDREGGIRGIPWSSSVMVQLNMLGGLWTAELATATAEANRYAVLKGLIPPDAEMVDGQTPGSATAESLRQTATELSSEGAMVHALAPGMEMEFPPPVRPNAELAPFSVALLRGIAAGLGVSYATLTADLSEANYSSNRGGLLSERNHWRTLQLWLVRKFCQPVYEAWIEMAFLSGQLKLPGFTGDPAKLCAPKWHPRSWTWIDPVKDVAATVTSLEAGIASIQDVAGGMGKDWHVLLEQMAEAKAYAESLGLPWPPTAAKQEAKPKEDPKNAEE